MCRQFEIDGRVQGVFFRVSTSRVARALGLWGDAINLPDGGVRVRACGGTDELAKLEDYLHEGPVAARVDTVRAFACECVTKEGFATG